MVANLIISEIVNYFTYALIVTAYSSIRKVPFWLIFFLLFVGLTPFFVNDFLFDPRYMNDQFKYLNVVTNIRDGIFEWSERYTDKVQISGRILALVPIPYIDSVQSLALANRLISSLMIIWLYSSIKVRGIALLFLLFYPSFLLYSALGLRDIIVLFVMIYSLLSYTKGKKLSAIGVSLILYFIKIQNFYLIIIFFAILELFSRQNILFRYKYTASFILILLSLPLLPDVINTYNFYARAMFIEDGGQYVNYVHLTSIYDVITRGPSAALYFIVKPFPWEVSNSFQLIQSLENIAVLGFLFFLFIKGYRRDRAITFRWVLILFVGLVVYGLVVANYGTAARYRFVLLLPIIICFHTELSMYRTRFYQSLNK